MTEKTQDQLVEEIVSQAAARAVDAVRKEHFKQQEETTPVEKPSEYVVSIKRRFWFPRKFHVVAHFEQYEADTQSGSVTLKTPRLVLQGPDGSYNYIPNLEKLNYSVYSKK